MASTKEYRDFILEQLSEAPDVSYHLMMGGFYFIRLCMVVDWCLEHPEYTTKIKVIPKKDYPVLMPCTF